MGKDSRQSALASTSSDWDLIIEPKSGLLNLELREVWRYRDLLTLLVRRDFITFYKQTVLGPLWFFLQPVLTTIIFTFIFGRIAKIGTGGVPDVVFYLSGIVLWNYFAECVNKTSTIFIQNANIFGKVYFPRIIMPLSIIVSNMLRFGVQLFLLLGTWLYFLFTTDKLNPNIYATLFPVLLFLMAGLGLGIGMIISSLTTKYRDLTFLVTFGIQLAMYASPVIYPLSRVGDSAIKYVVLANPMTGIIETFRYGFLGSGGQLNWFNLAYSAIVCIILLSLGTIIFNRIQRSFMDTV
jgi:lipopolysaccharide transport system permease protein